jgi:hypothetical protein
VSSACAGSADCCVAVDGLTRDRALDSPLFQGFARYGLWVGVCSIAGGLLVGRSVGRNSEDAAVVGGTWGIVKGK